MAEPLPSGKVLLRISGIGDVVVQLWPKECPKTCRNFVQLCMEGYYDDTAFHKLIPGLLVQGGDPTGTGSGGESIYDEGIFADEISQRLRFNRRGLLAMANMGSKNTNASQFFFTLDRADQFYGSNTLFGMVTGDTLFNLLKFNDLEVSDDRPTYPPTIKSTEVLENPFDDIQVRITASERKEQKAARKEMNKARAKDARRGKAIKNAGLLSFGADGEELATEGSSSLKEKKKVGGMKAASDLVPDENATRTVERDTQPAQSTSKQQEKPVKAQKPTTVPVENYEYVQRAEAAAEEAEKARMKAEIKALQASLKSMKKKKRAASDSESDSDAGDQGNKKARTSQATALDGAALLNAQREQYLLNNRSIKDENVTAKSLNGFKKELKIAKQQFLEAEKVKPLQETTVDGYAGEILEEEEYSDDNDMSFLSHKLQFRKDVTANKAQLDQYDVIDPREQGFTLEDAKGEEDRRRRKGQVPTQDRPAARHHAPKGGTRNADYRKRAGEERDWRGVSTTGRSARDN